MFLLAADQLFDRVATGDPAVVNRPMAVAARKHKVFGSPALFLIEARLTTGRAIAPPDVVGQLADRDRLAEIFVLHDEAIAEGAAPGRSCPYSDPNAITDVGTRRGSPSPLHLGPAAGQLPHPRGG